MSRTHSGQRDRPGLAFGRRTVQRDDTGRHAVVADGLRRTNLIDDEASGQIRLPRYRQYVGAGSVAGCILVAGVDLLGERCSSQITCVVSSVDRLRVLRIARQGQLPLLGDRRITAEGRQVERRRFGNDVDRTSNLRGLVVFRKRG